MIAKLTPVSASQPQSTTRHYSRLGHQARRALSLLELLVAMAILAILAVIIFSVYGGIRERAATVESASNLRVLSTALEHYRVDNDGLGPPYSYNTDHPLSEGHTGWGIRLLRHYYRTGPRYVWTSDHRFIQEPTEQCPLAMLRGSLSSNARSTNVHYGMAPDHNLNRGLWATSDPTRIPAIWQGHPHWVQSAANTLPLPVKDRGLYAAFMDGSVQLIEGTAEDGRLYFTWWNRAARNLDPRDQDLGQGRFIGEGSPR